MSFESYSDHQQESRAEVLMAHRERPKSHFEVQILLIEEYFLSLPENHDISEEDFRQDMKLQLKAAHRWQDDSWGAAFRILRSDKSRSKDILDTTLDDVREYLPLVQKSVQN
jgi:hypothetical protein